MLRTRTEDSMKLQSMIEDIDDVIHNNNTTSDYLFKVDKSLSLAVVTIANQLTMQAIEQGQVEIVLLSNMRELTDIAKTMKERGIGLNLFFCLRDYIKKFNGLMDRYNSMPDSKIDIRDHYNSMVRVASQEILDLLLSMVTIERKGLK